jgi:hypothetical protein
LGLNNFIGSGFISDDEASDSDSDSSDSDRRAYRRKRRFNASPTDYKNKDDSAEDFFDINELADEAPAEDLDPKDDYDDIEKAIPAVKVSTEGKSDHSDKNGNATNDKNLMPPPPQNAAPSIKQDDSDATIDAKSTFFFSF